MNCATFFGNNVSYFTRKHLYNTQARSDLKNVKSRKSNEINNCIWTLLKRLVANALA